MDPCCSYLPWCSRIRILECAAAMCIEILGDDCMDIDSDQHNSLSISLGPVQSRRIHHPA